MCSVRPVRILEDSYGFFAIFIAFYMDFARLQLPLTLATSRIRSINVFIICNSVDLLVTSSSKEQGVNLGCYNCFRNFANKSL
jgi:hypothetical protein